MNLALVRRPQLKYVVAAAHADFRISILGIDLHRGAGAS